MSRENRFISRRGVVLILLTISLAMSVAFHYLFFTKSTEVPFGHQLEHLVNLRLLNPEEQRKVALNKSLVTFSGCFRQQLEGQSMARYRYLEVLAARHRLLDQQQQLTRELASLYQEMERAAVWLTRLTAAPRGQDLWLLDPNIHSAIALQEQITPFPHNVQRLRQCLATGKRNSMPSDFQGDLLALIQGFRSPVLGIGNAELKKRLFDLEESIRCLPALRYREQLFSIYERGLATLEEIAALLEKSGKISPPLLRSARNYTLLFAEQQGLASALQHNAEQLKKVGESVSNTVWYFDNRELSSTALEEQDRDAFLHWFAQAKEEWESFSANQGASFRSPNQPCNTVLEKTFKSEDPSPNYLHHLLTTVPVLMLIVLLYLSFWRQMRGVGNSAISFGRSPARLLLREEHRITFGDVAGCQEAKEELEEIVEFLKNPLKFTVLGARIPKGVLCVGAPGTGKTLIAKAVAGEANRPFFSMSGSDFVEMFVGVGASRIRDLFAQAKRFAPCIIFIDEVDAVGRHRGAGSSGGHDEREQTLNQLLVEMDGFDPNEGVILIAATNRPDVLDTALLRPGRFDRRIIIDLPDVKGRYEILRVHAKRIQLDQGVNLMHLARNTPGASGAELANILNEAALLAARRGKRAVTAAEASEACDKVRYGKERKSLQLDEKEKLTTAYHESGHALVALQMQHADPVDKVTIIPRGLSLGATHFMPKKQRLNYWKQELLDQLVILMGGRASEELFVGDISSGAQADLLQATRLARSMVCRWGMTDKLGLVSYEENGDGERIDAPPEKRYSEMITQQIDAEVHEMLTVAHQRAAAMIATHRQQVELMTQMLMEFETLDREDVEEIFSGCWEIEKKRKRLQELDVQEPSPAVTKKQPKEKAAAVAKPKPKTKTKSTPKSTKSLAAS